MSNIPRMMRTSLIIIQDLVDGQDDPILAEAKRTSIPFLTSDLVELVDDMCFNMFAIEELADHMVMNHWTHFSSAEPRIMFVDDEDYERYLDQEKEERGDVIEDAGADSYDEEEEGEDEDVPSSPPSVQDTSYRWDWAQGKMVPIAEQNPQLPSAL
eukprot:TRINITY_DN3628_c0_g1_i2.p1 TRINITY_DN3628_c0_g1~~TRINITY_DN3628_c0_g1_i2.p1  ORF type:complete len:174 (-),score=56.44 TRINITY_DN3628_c0_g1_i2:60-527(-)